MSQPELPRPLDLRRRRDAGKEGEPELRARGDDLLVRAGRDREARARRLAASACSRESTVPAPTRQPSTCAARRIASAAASVRNVISISGRPPSTSAGRRARRRRRLRSSRREAPARRRARIRPRPRSRGAGYAVACRGVRVRGPGGTRPLHGDGVRIIASLVARGPVRARPLEEVVCRTVGLSGAGFV